jgi:CTP synthase
MSQPCRTIIITGGIVSGIGKGITAASIGRLLIDLGYSVAPIKADPYLNQDAGTMNPFQHGEVFLTEDGAETDLDLGHYERFLDLNLTRISNFTSGSVYRKVMDQERQGEFLGKTIQIIPHVTDEIKRRITQVCKEKNPDFLMVEVGGTVGDMEALPFIEAVRQYRLENPKNTINIHVVKMDYLYPSDESKTKPIQHAVGTLRAHGIQPDILIVRCKRPIEDEDLQKLSLFTGIPLHHIIPALDADSLYKIPAQLAKEGMVKAVMDSFNMTARRKNLHTWDEMYAKMAACKKTIKVGLVGKYLEQSDAYLSVLEAIRHAGIYHQACVHIVPINSSDATVAKQVKQLDAVIIPGGFGDRGIEGKIIAAQVARENKIPFLGICLGLQIASIEMARSLGKMKHATSEEFDAKSKEQVIAFLPDQVHVTQKGGTMRLGSYPAVLEKGSMVEKLYKTYRPDELVNHTIQERHRHRYEVNPVFHEKLLKTGMIFSGMSPDGTLVEFIELPKETHPYFVATQAHPEFRSRPHRPHPLFGGLIAAALKK